MKKNWQKKQSLTSGQQKARTIAANNIWPIFCDQFAQNPGILRHMVTLDPKLIYLPAGSFFLPEGLFFLPEGLFLLPGGSFLLPAG